MSIEELRASRYWSEEEGRHAVALWRKSGEPLAAFASRTGLRRARLRYWADRCDAATSTGIVLAPVTVLPASRAASPITIELLSGRAIKISGDVDDGLLARVIEVAERAGC
jgi:hypothetical protein